MKIKPLTKEQIIISIDRLTRFKAPEVKYLRVFKDIVIHNLLEPSFSKNDLDNMDYEKLKDYAQAVFNFSVKILCGENSTDFSLNKKISNYEKMIAYLDEKTQKLLNNELDYASCLKFIGCSSVKNLQWLKAMKDDGDIVEVRQNLGFRYPIEIVVIVEGATEETLLPEFGRLSDFDFDKNGVYIIPAGGKNQVVKLYYEMCEIFRLPIYVLLDKDGSTNARAISNKLRSKDMVHIIECGEFEDLLSDNLVTRALNTAFKNISQINDEIPQNTGRRVEFLEEIFKHRGMHEFKKVEFSQFVKENISSVEDLTPEIEEIIFEIKNLKSNS